MEKVTVRRTELLDILEKNQAAHLVELTDLQDEYLAAAKVTLEKALVNLVADKGLHVNLNAPKSSYVEYETAIGMLRMHTEETIELNHSEYITYVENRWHWQVQFQDLRKSYSSI